MALTFIKTSQGITFYFKGKNYTVQSSNPKFNTVIKAIKDNVTEDQLLKILDITIGVKRHVSGLFDVTASGQVSIDGTVLPTMLSNRILDCISEGFPVYPLITLWKNILQNPDKRAQTDLYAYLDHNQHPITPDGCFIAYRSVKPLGNGKFVDYHTGKFDNSVGQVVSMNRLDCDSNPEQTCSRGLHAASWEYVSQFGGGDRVVVNVKINPADVTAIPTDYNNRKLRCCKFEVLSVNEDFKPNTSPIHNDGTLVTDEEAFDVDDEYDTVPVEQADKVKQNWTNQVRDSKGRFVKT